MIPFQFGPKLSFGEMMLPTFGIPPLVLRPDRSSSTKYIEANELIPFFIRAPDDATGNFIVVNVNHKINVPNYSIASDFVHGQTII